LCAAKEKISGGKKENPALGLAACGPHDSTKIAFKPSSPGKGGKNAGKVISSEMLQGGAACRQG